VAGAATPAITALVAAGIPHEVLRYHHDPQNESFGEEAVKALANGDGDAGTAPAQILKTLVIALPKGLAVAVLPVQAQLSLKAAAGALGVARATMADRAAAERSTGYVIGGISPLGQRKRLPTVVDSSAMGVGPRAVQRGQTRLGCGANPQDLIRLTNAVTADIRAVSPS
jgi:Cys-tRNA(Pro)/Cys-tRNA(Cys) deacylase